MYVIDSRKAAMASFRKDVGGRPKLLTIGGQMRMQPVNMGNKGSEPAVVTKQIDIRTFEITEEAGTKDQRNRQQFRNTEFQKTPNLQFQNYMFHVPVSVKM